MSNANGLFRDHLRFVLVSSQGMPVDDILRKIGVGDGEGISFKHFWNLIQTLSTTQHSLLSGQSGSSCSCILLWRASSQPSTINFVLPNFSPDLNKRVTMCTSIPLTGVWRTTKVNSVLNIASYSQNIEMIHLKCCDHCLTSFQIMPV